MATTDRFQLVGTCLDDKFCVERLVAEGGFAVVYAGRHLALERPVAIKVLKTPSQYNDSARNDFIAKFRLEAKIIARLSHPNVVQVIDFGVSPTPGGTEAPWMALEWLTGTTLEDELLSRRGHGGRSGPEALALLGPIFDALAHAHDEGLAHRDVKPGNIMFISTKRGRTLKLLDFGIAKVMADGEAVEHSFLQTSDTHSSHTPAYAAPEQITGLKTGPWTDVHALALLLTEVMTDLPPYDGESVNTLLREILSPDRPTPARRRVDAGPWEAILAKAAALEPAHRYKDAGQFLAALKAALPAGSQQMMVWSLPPAPQRSSSPIKEESIPTPIVQRRRSVKVDEDEFERTFVRNPRRKPAIGVAIGLAVLLALGVGFWVNQRSKSSRSPSPPIAAGDAPSSPKSPSVSTEIEKQPSGAAQLASGQAPGPDSAQPAGQHPRLGSEPAGGQPLVAPSEVKGPLRPSSGQASTELRASGFIAKSTPAATKRRTAASRKPPPKQKIELE